VPKIVDHEQRRTELANAALRVIGRYGMEAATTRTVAAESGWSTGVLKHYFSSKQDLLRSALDELERANLERFQEAREQPNGFARIREAVAKILAAGPEESAVWVAYIERARVDPSTARVWHRGMARWSERWAELVREGQADGSVDARIDPQSAGVELHALVNGLRIAVLLGARDPGTEATLVELLCADQTRSRRRAKPSPGRAKAP
jgi:AcrR family transcriptional regulator